MYDKHGFILRIETTANDVSFFKHYRKVEHRDGTTETKWTSMKKGIYSLSPLRDVLCAANRRYLEFISAIDTPTAGIDALRKISETLYQGEHSYPGFNLFHSPDCGIFLPKNEEFYDIESNGDGKRCDPLAIIA